MKDLKDNEVKEIIISLLERNNLTKTVKQKKDINFERLDSLNIMSILAELEEDFSIEIDLEEMDFRVNFLSIENLISFLRLNSKQL
tara:strand:+ start:221 stop:478 length:258 start_codon:yes stop_codon:yes gene_type:complete